MMQPIPPTWRMVKLGDLTLPVERKDPASQFTETFSYIDISAVDNVSKKVVGRLEQNVREAPSRARQLVYSGDVLVSTVRPALNAVAAVPHGLSDGVASTGFCVLRSRPDALLPEYLLRFVVTDTFIQGLVSRQKGGAYPAVTDDEVRSVPIPLPPLSEQQRIVDILQEAEEIDRLRAEAEAKTAELAPAMFDAIFGVPSDWKGGPRLGDMVRIVGGGTPRRNVEHFYSGTIPWATSKDIKKLYLDDTEEHVTEEAVQSSATNVVPKGTVLVVVKSKILAHTLPVAITQVPMCFGQDIKGMIPNSGVTPEFLIYSIQAQLARVLSRARGANTEGLTLESLKSLEMPEPSAELVERFRTSCEEIRGLAEATIAGTRISFLTRASLSTYAFSGRLTADWREANQRELALEARERDTMLKEVGANLSRSRRATIQEMESIWEQPTDGIYSELNREQRDLLFRIQQSVGGVQYARYFSAQSLSQSFDGPLRQNPHAIEGHLAVLAARGLVVPVSREEQTEDTGDFVYGNAYRLPSDHQPTEGEEGGLQVGDHTQGRELERLAAQLERERALT